MGDVVPFRRAILVTRAIRTIEGRTPKQDTIETLERAKDLASRDLMRLKLIYSLPDADKRALRPEIENAEHTLDLIERRLDEEKNK